MNYETQSQINDALFLRAQRYMQNKKITSNKLAEEVGMSPYILNKALDRRIKMKLFDSSIEKILETVTKL